jgi:hypothetical protein
MRVVETRSYLDCRIQIGEHSQSGWTVELYPPSPSGKIQFASDDPASLPGLLSTAKAKAREFRLPRR